MFENGVGRPSNEIKKKRKIFIASIIITIALLVTIGGILLFGNFNTNKLKGEINSNPPLSWVFNDSAMDFDNEDYFSNGLDLLEKHNLVASKDLYIDGKSINLEVQEGGSVKKVKAYIYDNKSLKEPIAELTEKNYFMDIYRYDFDISKVAEDYFIDKGVYIKFETYSSVLAGNKNKLWEGVYFYKSEGNKDCRGCFKLSKVIKSTYASSIKINSLTLSCPKEAVEGEPFSCTYKSGSKQIKITPIIIGKYNNINDTKLFSDHGLVSVILDKKGSGTITFMRKGYKTVTKDIKVKKGTLKITCPSSIYANEPFVCVTNLPSVVDIKGSLDSGSTAKRYTQYENELIEKHNGTYGYRTQDITYKKAGTATITVSKDGYKTITKKLTVKQQKKSNQTKKQIELKCPTSAMIGEKFKCSTNQTGAKITVGGAKSLASGVNASFTTTASDKTKSIQYASRLFTDYKTIIKKDGKGEYINAKITASKTGYSSTTKYVKIYKTKTSGTTTKSTTKKTTKKITTVNNDDKKANFSVSAVWKGVGKDKKFNIIQGAFGSKVKYLAYVVCENKADCVRSDAWDYMNKKDSSAAVSSIKAKKGDSRVLKLKTSDSNNPANKTYYIRRSTYDANKKILYYSVYEIKTASSPRKGDAGDVYNTTLKYVAGKFY